MHLSAYSSCKPLRVGMLVALAFIALSAGRAAGAEGPGLSRLVRERCDQLVSIPMRGRVASLNVGTAGTLYLIVAAVLSGMLVHRAWRVLRSASDREAMLVDDD